MSYVVLWIHSSKYECGGATLTIEYVGCKVKNVSKNPLHSPGEKDGQAIQRSLEKNNQGHRKIC